MSDFIPVLVALEEKIPSWIDTSSVHVAGTDSFDAKSPLFEAPLFLGIRTGNTMKYLNKKTIENILIDLQYMAHFWNGWTDRSEDSIREWVEAIRDEFDTMNIDRIRFIVKDNGVLNNARYDIRHLLRNGVNPRVIIEAIKNNAT